MNADQFFFIYGISPHYGVFRKEQYSRNELRYFVDENAKNLPIKTDAVTTITGIMLFSENTIMWRYTIDKEKLISFHAQSENMSDTEYRSAAIREYGSVENYIKTWKEKIMKSTIIKRNCSTPSVKEMIDRGVNFKHSYFEENGEYFYEVFVNKSSCN